MFPQTPYVFISLGNNTPYSRGDSHCVLVMHGVLQRLQLISKYDLLVITFRDLQVFCLGSTNSSEA